MVLVNTFYFLKLISLLFGANFFEEVDSIEVYVFNVRILIFKFFKLILYNENYFFKTIKLSKVKRAKKKFRLFKNLK